jgi:anthranilate phosphoribosyltransferase
VAGRAASVQAGIHLARAAVDNGRAEQWLNRVRQFAAGGP